MTNALAQRLHTAAALRAAASRHRVVRTAEGIDCSSNDYLGLAGHATLADAARGALARGVAVSASGSRLLSGHHPEHHDVEERFARYVERDAALLFGSGYLANLALLSALPERRDLILLDAAAHASLKEGARASLAARRTFRHNDVAHLERTLRDRDAFDQVFIVVEGVYSMDGDRAPMTELISCAARHGAHLIVDEAHATGLFGAALRGVHRLDAGLPMPLATIHPCGKALGVSGAFIAADRAVIDHLINTARPFLFSTAPSPLEAVMLAAAVELLPSMADRASVVLARARRLRELLVGLERWQVPPGEGPIVPIIVGEDAEAVRAAAHVSRAWGFDLRAIRPPTVPAGSARLRVSLTWNFPEAAIEPLAQAIIDAERAEGEGSA